MRPRHYTAENRPVHPPVDSGVRASMRPRHYTAENVVDHERGVFLHVASMRPRHYTAENPIRGKHASHRRQRLQ